MNAVTIREKVSSPDLEYNDGTLPWDRLVCLRTL